MAMEESKELQTAYKIFRTLIYVSLVVEFFMFAIQPEVVDAWNGILNSKIAGDLQIGVDYIPSPQIMGNFLQSIV
jgi:hypothetical protein